jgi:hypothetical protein
MLSHEVNLIEKRLSRENIPIKCFLVMPILLQLSILPNNLKVTVGISYQIEPDEDYNEIIIHIRFKETDVRLQQETLGILGVNLIYGAYYKYNDPKRLLRYLYDHLDKDQLEIDTINFFRTSFC